MATGNPRARRESERGGVTILTVLVLLVLATVMIFSMGRNSLREIILSGTSMQSAKASEASEAGLDWFLLWANKGNWGAATGYQRDVFLSEFQALCSTNWQDRNYPLAAASKTYDRASLITPATGTTATAATSTSKDMIFSNSGSDFQQSTATGNQTVQSFELAFRCLGPATLTRTTSSTSTVGSNLNLFQVQATGKASITGTNTEFHALREMMAVAIP